MYLILSLFLMMSCSFENTEQKVDKSKELMAMDSDGDQVSDYDEIRQGTNRYVANLVIEKPEIKNLSLKLEYKVEGSEKVKTYSKNFDKIKLIDFQKELLSYAHHEHGNYLVNQLLDPHKDSFRIDLKTSDRLSLKIDSKRLSEVETETISVVFKGELKNFEKGQVFEIFLGNSYIGAIESKKFEIVTTVEDFITLLGKGENLYLRVADFKIGDKTYPEFKRALLQNSRLIAISYPHKRVEYFVSKKIKNLKDGFKQIFSKTYTGEDDKITRLGSQVINDYQGFVTAAIGNPYESLNSEVRVSLVDRLDSRMKSDAQGVVSSTYSESKHFLGIIDRNSSFKLMLRVYNQNGSWYNRKVFDYSNKKCPRTGCYPWDKAIRCTYEILKSKKIASTLSLKAGSSHELHYFSLEVNNKRYNLRDVLKEKRARFKIVNSKEAVIEFDDFEHFFDGDETSELKLIVRGAKKVFWEGLRVARFKGQITCLLGTSDLMARSKSKLAPTSVNYGFIRKALKLPNSRIAKKRTVSLQRNIGYSFELKGAIHE